MLPGSSHTPPGSSPLLTAHSSLRADHGDNLTAQRTTAPDERNNSAGDDDHLGRPPLQYSRPLRSTRTVGAFRRLVKDWYGSLTTFATAERAIYVSAGRTTAWLGSSRQTKTEAFKVLYLFWVKIFAISFDPDARIITLSIGAEVPPGPNLPHLVIIKSGEKRPVVVCQHGLEGRPRDVADPNLENAAYHRYACQLAERGFVTFAPQNPYRRFRSGVSRSHTRPVGGQIPKHGC